MRPACFYWQPESVLACAAAHNLAGNRLCEGGQSSARRAGGIRSLGKWQDRSIIAQTESPRSRRAFAITDTELKLIARAAIIGDSNWPVKGYKAPAANGIPIAL